jgi:hypothetical protein
VACRAADGAEGGVTAVDVKKIGIIALVVVAVVLLAWSFNKNVLQAGGSAPVGPDRAQEFAEKMKASYAQMEQSQKSAPQPAAGGGSGAAGRSAGPTTTGR